MKTQTALFALTALVWLVRAVWEYRYRLQQLADWIRQEKMTLLSSKRVRYSDGHGSYFERVIRLYRYQATFEIKVIDPAGRTKEGWVVFEHPWNPFSAASDDVEVHWDES
jgi:hypothetical protein